MRSAMLRLVAFALLAVTVSEAKGLNRFPLRKLTLPSTITLLH